jgi:hypothetical protein
MVMKIFTTCLLALGVLAGCATTGGLGTAANRLDDASRRFHEQLQAERVAGRMESDAAVLADAARDFHRAVSQGGSRDDLRASFDRVAERYHGLRLQLDNREYSDRFRRAGFDRVTQAYLDVDRSMNHPGSR